MAISGLNYLENRCCKTNISDDVKEGKNTKSSKVALQKVGHRAGQGLGAIVDAIPLILGVIALLGKFGKLSSALSYAAVGTGAAGTLVLGGIDITLCCKKPCGKKVISDGAETTNTKATTKADPELVVSQGDNGQKKDENL